MRAKGYWFDISTDPIGFPKPHGKEVIMVVVNNFTSYAYFVDMVHPYTSHQMVCTHLQHDLWLWLILSLLVDFARNSSNYKEWIEPITAYHLQIYN